MAGGIAEESIEGVKTVASCNAQGTLLRSLLWMYWVRLGNIYALFFTYAGEAFYFSAYLISNDHDSWTGADLDARAVNVIVITKDCTVWLLTKLFRAFNI